jgi:hypothetical protein
MHLVGIDTLLILLNLGPGHHHATGQDITPGHQTVSVVHRTVSGAPLAAPMIVFAPNL